MTQVIYKRHMVRIPTGLSLIYSKKKKMITFITTKNQKNSLKLKVQVFINANLIEVSSMPFDKVSTKTKKTLKNIQGLTVAEIKYIFLNFFVKVFCQKMKFVGVGYRAVLLNPNSPNKCFNIRLGFSHQLYFNCVNNINVFCFKFTKLFVVGNSHQHVTQVSALLRAYRSPDPYKGKGVLYENEKITLKVGKRV